MNRVIEKFATLQTAQAYLVGGFVRDRLMGFHSNDLDFEVFGMNQAELESFLNSAFGRENVEVTGKGFPVYRVKDSEFDIQVALPRTERKIGTGYNGFITNVDPNMSLKDAALRRDLTINAIYLNPFTNEYIDVVNGIQDLQDKLLSPVSFYFKDDPVRVLRVAYFAARFDFDWTFALVKYANELYREFRDIAPKKVYEVFYKTGEKAKKPSRFMQFLKDSEWINFFGSLNLMEQKQQNLVWHPEGNVWNHTLMVMDYYAANFGSDFIGFMATMLHDYGKIYTTTKNDKGNWTAIGHELISFQRADEVLFAIDHEFDHTIRRQILELCKLHMLVKDEPTAKKIRKVGSELNFTTFEQLYKVCKADQLSRQSELGLRPPDYDKTMRNLANWQGKYTKVLPNEKFIPIVTGDDLIALGFKPGKELGNTLKYFRQMQIDGTLRDENKETFVPAMVELILNSPTYVTD